MGVYDMITSHEPMADATSLHGVQLRHASRTHKDLFALLWRKTGFLPIKGSA